MSLANTFYNTLVKKNSVFVATIFASAFAFEVAFDTTSTKVWDNLNKGVSTRLFFDSVVEFFFFFFFQRTLETEASIETLVSTQIESTSSCVDMRFSVLLVNAF
jgi:ubiquinol-cytochrome c reductase subunit 9